MKESCEYQVQPLQRNETQKMYDLGTVFRGHC